MAGCARFRLRRLADATAEKADHGARISPDNCGVHAHAPVHDSLQRTYTMRALTHGLVGLALVVHVGRW